MIQAVSGLMSLTGDPDGGPVKAAAPVADVMGGLSAVIAIMGAVVLASKPATSPAGKVD